MKTFFNSVADLAGSHPSKTPLGGNIPFKSRRGLKMTTATLLCGAALLLLAAPTRAAIALVDSELATASTFNNTSTGLLLTTNLTVSSSANTLVVVVDFRNNSANATEAPSTLNWTNATTTNVLTLAVQKGDKGTSGGGRNVAIYYCYNPTAGTGFNTSGKLAGQAGSSGALVAYTLSGVDTTVTPPTSGSAAAQTPPAGLSFVVDGAVE